MREQISGVQSDQIQSDILLEVRHLKKYFPVYSKGIVKKAVGNIKAVDDVSFQLKRGEVLGLVGESGCGKSTIGKTILRLVEPTDGEIIVDGKDFRKLNKKELRLKRRDLQMIFQDPYSSLDARMTARQTIEEAMIIHNLGDRESMKKRVDYLLEVVGLASYHANRYPQEFSGGQRQRIGIARALAANPKLIICDEPVSALDVSVQAQVLNLLKDLQKEFNLTYLFIAHGLSVVKHVSDRVGVMYLGKLVELANKDELYGNHKHPYTAALMAAIPIPDPEKNEGRLVPLEGEVPSPANPPSGCRFHTRCSMAHRCNGRCEHEEPELRQVAPDHWVACHLID
ncbi:ABC transporter ATP-binding protein [Enterocloster lavalensis]|uniref:ABC transporter ATP-binding protein n=1 Tax=Enterocloster lavalensis TaxID=460384 RepID=UPI0034A34E2C